MLDQSLLTKVFLSALICSALVVYGVLGMTVEVRTAHAQSFDYSLRNHDSLDTVGNSGSVKGTSRAPRDEFSGMIPWLCAVAVGAIIGGVGLMSHTNKKVEGSGYRIYEEKV